MKLIGFFQDRKDEKIEKAANISLFQKVVKKIYIYSYVLMKDLVQSFTPERVVSDNYFRYHGVPNPLVHYNKVVSGFWVENMA